MSWNRKGTVTILENSKIVAGTGTTWFTDGISSGDIFLLGDKIYEIDFVSNNTSLNLKESVLVPVTDVSYAIVNQIAKIPDNSQLSSKLLAIMNFWQSRDVNVANWITSQDDTVPMMLTSGGAVVNVPTVSFLARKATEGSLAVETGTSDSLIFANQIGVAHRTGATVTPQKILNCEDFRFGLIKNAVSIVNVLTSGQTVNLDMTSSNMFVVNMNGKSISSLSIFGISQAASGDSLVTGIIEFNNAGGTQANISSLIALGVYDKSISNFPLILNPNQVVAMKFYTYDNGATFRFMPILVS